jgi:TIR domain
MEAPMPRVFISHSTKDREFVERDLLPFLREHGIDAWYAPDDIQTAAHWERTILTGLQGCDWFLLLMSPRSAESEWVRDEVNWAISHREGRIVPVMVEACDPYAFHIRMSRIQHIDFRSDSETARRKLLKVWGIDLHRPTPAPAPSLPVAPPPRPAPVQTAPRPAPPPAPRPPLPPPPSQAPAGAPGGTLDNIKREFAEQVKLRAYDDKYLDRNEEREVLQIALIAGVTVDSARAALAQVCEANGYILESVVIRKVREMLAVYCRNDGRLREKEFQDTLALCQQECRGKKDEQQCKRLVLQTIADGEFPIQTGLFSNWYERQKKQAGLS